MSNAVSKPDACRICGSMSVSLFQAREMMFGLRETFAYFECNGCKCVQASSYPSDIARHYPSDYYAYIAHAETSPPGGLAGLKGMVRSFALKHGVTRSMWLRRQSNRNWLAKEPLLNLYIERFPDAATRILDVGCGTGDLPRSLRFWGFKKAEGVDPYIKGDVVHEGRTLVWKRHLSEMTPSYHCISFHHSLEHMPDQAKVLSEARRLLAPDGIVLIRIPVAGTEAWRTYRENWVQLDPPRHFYLHSETSLRLVAQQAGLFVDEIQYDSTGLQIWGSELYCRDIPLFDERSPARNSHAVFSAEQLALCDKRANALNAAGDGDQMMAVLRAA